MPFVKVDTGLLDSTVWQDVDARVVFITALLMAQPREYRDRVPQLSVRCLEPTGWVAPAGWYGFVAASGTGIIKRAGIDAERGLDALEKLGAPDPESRTPDHEGRRLVRVDGGYIVLNFQRYRDRDYTTAARSRAYRERQRASRCDATASCRGATVQGRDVTQAEVRSQKSEVEASLHATTPSWTRGVGGDTLTLLQSVCSAITPQLPLLEEPIAALWVREIDSDPWWLAAVICESQASLAAGKTYAYVTKALRNRKAEGWSCEDARGYVESRLALRGRSRVA